MASFRFGYVPDAGQGPNVTAQRTVSQANLNRAMAAHKARLGVSTDQEVCERILDKVMRELIGVTKRQEKEAQPVADFPVT